MAAMFVQVALEAVECIKCGEVFGMSETMVVQRKRTHETFYCPKGHQMHWPGQSDTEKLRDQLAKEKHLREQAEADARAKREQAEAIARRLSATQGVVTRQKRRIAGGQCPCCQHEFNNLALHMRRHHPNWNPLKEVEART